MKTFDCSDLTEDDPVKVLLPNGMLARIKLFGTGVIIDGYVNQEDFDNNEPTGGVVVP